MPKFWQHYAKANDDVRSELIDKAWFDKRVPNNDAMQRDVQAQAAKPRPVSPQPMQGQTVWQNEQTHGPQGSSNLYGQDAKQPEAKGLYGAQQPQTAQSADLYGKDTPQSDRGMGYGYDGVEEADHGDVYGHDPEQADSGSIYGDSGGLYGHDPNQEEQGTDIHGNGPDQNQSNDLYGYDALDEPQQDIHGREEMEPER